MVSGFEVTLEMVSLDTCREISQSILFLRCVALLPSNAMNACYVIPLHCRLLVSCCKYKNINSISRWPPDKEAVGVTGKSLKTIPEFKTNKKTFVFGALLIETIFPPFQMPDYQAKKKRCKELRQKLFHIKRLVKIYDQGIC